MAQAKLTAKQRRFVAEYLIDSNASAAAKRAGYSAKTADEIGYQLLKKPHIAEAVQEKLGKIEAKLEVTAERVIAELARVAFSNMKRLVSWEDGQPKLIDSSLMEEDDSAALKSIGYSESSSSTGGGSSRSFAVHDKVKALEILAKHFKLLTDKIEHTGKDGEPLSFIQLVEQYGEDGD